MAKNVAIITLKFGAGSTIEGAFQEAIRIAQQLDVEVEFTFNDVVCFANKNSNVNEGILYYNNCNKEKASKNSVSCRLLFIENSKTINGYSQINSMEKALGFESPYDLHMKINKYGHLINAGDVVTVCKWLFENGYDVVKLNGN